MRSPRDDGLDKDRLISSLKQELHAQRRQMEATVRSLLDRNDQQDRHMKDAFSKTQHEFSGLEREKESLKRECGELRKQLDDANELLRGVQSFADEGSAMHRQLSAENHEFLQHKEVLERELAHLRQSLRTSSVAESEARAQFEVALAKLAKADVHIQKLCEEVASLNVKCLEFQHASETANQEKGNIDTQKIDCISTFSRILFGLAEETEMLLLDSDELSARARDALTGEETGSAALETIAASRSLLRRKRAGNPLKNDVLVPLRCLPEHIGSLKQLEELIANDPETHLRCVGANITDALSLVRDDVAVTLRAIDEEGVVRSVKAVKHFAALEEAVAAERAHTKTLLSQLDAAVTENKRHETELSQFRNAQQQSDVFMKEAARLAEENVSRVASLQQDLGRVERENLSMKEAVSQLEQRHSESLSTTAALRSEVESWRWKCEQLESSSGDKQADFRRLSETVQEMRAEVARLQDKNREEKKESEDLRQHIHRLEVDLSFFRKKDLDTGKRLEDTSNLLRTRDRELADAQSSVQRRVLQTVSSVPNRAVSLTPGPLRGLSVSQEYKDESDSSKVASWDTKLSDLFSKVQSTRAR